MQPINDVILDEVFTDDELRVIRDALAIYQMGTVGRDRQIAADLLAVLEAAQQ